MRYLCLLRGVNVGGKNKISMSELKISLEAAGFTEAATFLNSGNVIVSSPLKTAAQVGKTVENLLLEKFKFDSELIKVRALTSEELQQIIESAPQGFGSEPNKYHSDVLFPMDTTSSQVMAVAELNPEVDTAWEAGGVVYFQRLSAKRTKSRLNRIISKPVYKSITIRTWNTTTKLLALLNA